MLVATAGPDTATCDTCGTLLPPAYRYCWTCGAKRASRSGAAREDGFRAQPAELVRQLAVISTLMPVAPRTWADALRWAGLACIAVLTVLTLAGLLPAAVAGAAVLLPVMYGMYLSRAGFWASLPHPVPAMLALSLVPALLGLGFTFALTESPLGRGAVGLLFGAPGQPETALPVILLATIVAVVLGAAVMLGTNVVPVFLAQRPEFDDLLDGFALGVGAGVAYAAGESLIGLRGVFTVGVQTSDPLPWIAILLNVAAVKPLVYALAAGLAVAAFSGIGRGYDGFCASYARMVVGSAIVISLYWFGTIVLGPWPAGPVLALLWGAALAAVLIVMTRETLQAALLERTLLSATGGGAVGARASDCDECDMPLTLDAEFCAYCGVSQRATPAGRAARHPSTDSARPPAASSTAWAIGSGASAAAWSRRSTTVVVLGATLAVASIGLVVAVLLEDTAISRAPIAETRLFPSPDDLVGDPDDRAPGHDISLPSPQPGDLLLADRAVVLPVAAGWTVTAGGGERWALVTDGGSLWMYVEAVSTSPGSHGSEDLLLRAYDARIMSPAGMHASRASVTLDLAAFGAIEDRSMQSVSGLHVDGLFGAAFRSNLYAGMRADGLGLVVEVRDYSADSWDERINAWFEPMYEPIWRSFAGAPLPSDE